MFSTAQPLKIIIADDHPLMRAAIIRHLDQVPGLQVVAEAGTGTALLQLTALHHPDLIFVDIQMPEMDGIEATRIITEKYPRTIVIAITIFLQEHIIGSMLQAGAMGFLTKDVHPDELLKAIRAVTNNETYYCPSATLIVNKMISNDEYDPVKRQMTLLTRRESETLLLICKGKTNKEISEILNISVRTVEQYRSNLLNKADTKNMAGLLSFAIRKGIYNPEADVAGSKIDK